MQSSMLHELLLCLSLDDLGAPGLPGPSSALPPGLPPGLTPGLPPVFPREMSTLRSDLFCEAGSSKNSPRTPSGYSGLFGNNLPAAEFQNPARSSSECDAIFVAAFGGGGLTLLSELQQHTQKWPDTGEASPECFLGCLDEEGQSSFPAWGHYGVDVAGADAEGIFGGQLSPCLRLGIRGSREAGRCEAEAVSALRLAQRLEGVFAGLSAGLSADARRPGPSVEFPQPCLLQCFDIPKLPPLS
mmetsp:Transcript_10881/g.27466  ORF Transcript_10881/g.27466 Transcript_10881/m.27466 type:complete len:243 (-) Transcript_10881:125-853(-)